VWGAKAGTLKAVLTCAAAVMQQKLALALREYRLLYVTGSRSSSVPHNKLIFPPTLRYLPVWLLGAPQTRHTYPNRLSSAH
jgi:hypothetical protein